MDELVPWIEGGATQSRVQLLRAGASEGPSDEAVRNAEIALGLAGVAGAVAGLSSAAGTPQGLGTPAVAKSALGLLSFKLWALVLGGVGVVAVGGVLLRSGMPITSGGGGSPPATEVSPPSAASPVTGSPSEVPNPTLRAELSPSFPSSLPSVAAARPGEHSPPDSVSQSARSTLKLQIQLIDRARSRLARGDAPGALATLAEYRRDYPQGALGEEATLLQIEALAASGQGGAARQLGDAFLRRNPKSPHGTRIRALLGGP